MLIKKQIRMCFGIAFVALAVALPAAQARPTSTVARAATSETTLLAAVNAARTANGLRPFAVDAALTRVAQSHSAQLLRVNTLTHGAFGSRLARSGARGPSFGENLAYGAGSLANARAIVASWLRSPTHRANLLRPGFRRIGIGARVGSFAGRSGTLVVTADFAGR